MLRSVFSCVIAFLACSPHTLAQLGDTDTENDEAFRQEFEVIKVDDIYQYAQSSSFSLLTFNVPANAQKVQFQVSLTDRSDDEVNRTIVLALRQSSIPVLQAFNETVPKFFFLPPDQQTHHVYGAQSAPISLTLPSPVPGPVYMAATVLNPLDDVVNFLCWGEALGGQWTMKVRAIYTVRTTPVPTLPVDDVTNITMTVGQVLTFSFMVPAFTTAYTTIISHCGSANDSSCPVVMKTADSLALDDSPSVSVDCRQQGEQCRLTVVSPMVERQHYVTFSMDDSKTVGNVSFEVSFNVTGCLIPAAQYSVTQQRSVWNNNSFVVALPSNRTKYLSGNPGSSLKSGLSSASYIHKHSGVRFQQGQATQTSGCFDLGQLGRVSSAGSSNAFNAFFGTWTTEGDINKDFDVVVHDNAMEVQSFILHDSADNGGVLSVSAVLLETDWNGTVWVCAMSHRLPQNSSVNDCGGGALLALNSTSADHKGAGHVRTEAYLPFPASGSWYMAMQSQCWGDGPQPCTQLPLIQLSVGMTQCAHLCGKYGKCQLYFEDTTIFSGCQCFAGYRGLSCNDNQHSLSDGEQLTAVYLLTLSNLSFIPAILLALYRRYFILAVIFFFNCFFSTFYHACDTGDVFNMCIMDYNTLSFADFFGSVLSFYSVLLTMARIPEACRNFLLISGALLIAVSQNGARHSDLGHILPLAAAGVVLVVSWIRVMWTRKRLFPSKRRYLFFLLPGIVLALTGIGVNFGFMQHKSTYQYTHSFWHFSLMIAPCFLMPPRRKANSDSNKGLSISAQDIIRVGHDQQQSPQQPSQPDDDEPAMFDASMNSLGSERSRLI